MAHSEVIQAQMSLDPKALEKPLVKLRKLVRKMSKVPTQEEVHDIRTNTRRVEATLEALQLGQRRQGRQIVRAVTPMRKRTGAVRDMDVLTGYLASLPSDGHDQCLVQLLEYLGEERARGATRLRKTVRKRRRTTSKRLKACAFLIEKKFEKNAKQQKEWPGDAVAAALRTSGELTNWPRLSAENLHPFRLKVKEMQYVLKLSDKDHELTDRLGEVKDQIGEWHDWSELNAIAKKTLSGCKGCKVIAQIDKSAKQKFEAAMKAAQQLRSNYFERQSGRQKRNRGNVAIKDPVLQATAGLAA